MSILGPVRSADQVELSATDARSIGLGIDIRESGDIAGTPGCTLRGPAGEVTIKEGVIVAKRHIHLTPETSKPGDTIKRSPVHLSRGSVIITGS